MDGGNCNSSSNLAGIEESVGRGGYSIQVSNDLCHYGTIIVRHLAVPPGGGCFFVFLIMA